MVTVGAHRAAAVLALTARPAVPSKVALDGELILLTLPPDNKGTWYKPDAEFTNGYFSVGAV